MPNGPIDLQLPTIVPLHFPVKGVNLNWARSAQPDLTTPDALNVMPYDLSNRNRGGQRSGILQSGTNFIGGGGTSTTFCQWMQQVTVENAAVITYIQLGGAYLYNGVGTATRYDYLTCFTSGKGYYGTSAASLNLIGGSGRKPAENVMLIGALIDSHQYLLDGAGILEIDFSVTPPEWVNYAATAGTSPDTLLPRICCVYRKRLVVGRELGGDGNPENFYASRVGNAHDWDYGKTDPGAAFAGNASKAGQVGEPIVALIPLGDDALVIGCDKSIWLMNGDIQDGGRIDVLTRGVGMIDQTAHCFDPQGNLYFLGTNGFYRMRRGIYTLENLSSDTYNDYFLNAQPSGAQTLVYDKVRHGIWIFRTPFPDTGSPPLHIWWDARTGGFFPMQFQHFMGPLRAIQFESSGNSVKAEILLSGSANLGGTNALAIFHFEPGIAHDAGYAIDSFAILGPICPGSISQESKLLGCDFTLGETPSGFIDTDVRVDVTVQAGSSAFEALNNPRSSSQFVFTGPGRQTFVYNRIRGESFCVLMVGGFVGKTWSLDQAAGHFMPGGRVRV